jgi:hypothetical protein
MTCEEEWKMVEVKGSRDGCELGCKMKMVNEGNGGTLIGECGMEKYLGKCRGEG